MNRLSWIDQILSEQQENGRKNIRAWKKLLEDLKQDYRKILESRNMLVKEGENVAYPQLKSDIDQLISEKNNHAQILKKLITELGGKVENETEIPGENFARGHFKEIFTLETELSELLTEHANFAEDNGYYELSDELRSIRDQQVRLNEQLERIIMKINTEI